MKTWIISTYSCRNCGKGLESRDCVLGGIPKSFTVIRLRCPACGGKVILSGAALYVGGLLLILFDSLASDEHLFYFLAAPLIAVGIVRIVMQLRERAIQKEFQKLLKQKRDPTPRRELPSLAKAIIETFENPAQVWDGYMAAFESWENEEAIDDARKGILAGSPYVKTKPFDLLKDTWELYLLWERKPPGDESSPRILAVEMFRPYDFMDSPCFYAKQTSASLCRAPEAGDVFSVDLMELGWIPTPRTPFRPFERLRRAIETLITNFQRKWGRR